ncbi:MAG: type III secretion system chaperone, partial [Pseudomonadota bacterium]
AQAMDFRTIPLVKDLEHDFGLALIFDDQGRSAVRDKTGRDIGIFFRQEGKCVFVCAEVDHVDDDDPKQLFQSMLEANMTIGVAHDFHFGLDHSGHQIMIYQQLRVSDITAADLVERMDYVAATRDAIGQDIRAALDGNDRVVSGSTQMHEFGTTIHV